MVRRKWQELRKKIRKSEFGRHILTVFSGTLAAQIFSFLILPLLAYLFTPEDIGIRGVFLAVQASLAIALNGGYELAIMLPEKEEDAGSLLGLCLLLNMAVSLLVLGILLLGGSAFWALIQTDELDSWQYLLLISLLLEGINQPLRIYANRHGHYARLTYSKMAQPIIGGIFMLLFGYLGWGFPGLLLGSVIGQVAAALVLIFDSLSYLRDHPQPFSLLQFGRMARLYQDFPKKGMGSAWLNVLSSQLPMFFLPAAYGKEVAGNFHLAQKALMMPFAMISKAVGDVFYEQASKARIKSQQALAKLTRQTFFYLALGGLLPAILIMALAPSLIAWGLDESWYETGTYIRWLMPWVYITLLAIPLSFIMDIQRKLGFQFRYQMGSFIIRGMALLIGVQYLDAKGEVILYSLCCTLLGAYLIWEMLRMAGVKAKNYSPS